jgi:23S rRNA pseudouridine2605 synthase
VTIPAARVRVNRFLAGRGVGSRRTADRLVEEGRVRVNGRAATPGALVDPEHDAVTVDGRPVPPPVAMRTLMVNKPPGVVSTRSDPQGRPTVLDLVEQPEGLFPVGRLDTPSRGLILLTSDGALSLRLTHPSHGVLKRYLVTVKARATVKAIRHLLSGVALEDGFARAAEARLVDHGRLGDVVEIAMAEGRKREVRRLCAACGLPVVDLQRVAIGPLRLGRLLEGAARPLSVPELGSLYASVGLEPPRRHRPAR